MARDPCAAWVRLHPQRTDGLVCVSACFFVCRVVEALEAQQVLGSIRQYPTWRGLSGRFNAATGVLLARGAKPAASSAPVRMVLTADWASGTVESDYVGQLMASEKGRPDWTLNAGDVYWTGTPTNVKQTCLGKPKNNDPGQRGVKWPSGRLGSFAVLGNHGESTQQTHTRHGAGREKRPQDSLGAFFCVC